MGSGCSSTAILCRTSSVSSKLFTQRLAPSCGRLGRQLSFSNGSKDVRAAEGSDGRHVSRADEPVRLGKPLTAASTAQHSIYPSSRELNGCELIGPRSYLIINACPEIPYNEASCMFVDSVTWLVVAIRCIRHLKWCRRGCSRYGELDVHISQHGGTIDMRSSVAQKEGI